METATLELNGLELYTLKYAMLNSIIEEKQRINYGITTGSSRLERFELLFDKIEAAYKTIA